MTFSLLTDSLWIASVIGNISLLVVLCVRARWRVFPIFTALASFEIVRAGLLFSAFHGNKPSVYYWTYWITEAVDRLLQVAILWELGRRLLVDSKHRTAQPSLLTMIRASTFAVLIAIGFSALLPGVGSSKQNVDMHASVFTSLLTCELFLLFSLVSSRLGVRRTEHIVAISNGLALISALSLALDVTHQALGWSNNPVIFDQAESTVAVFILIYWTRSLWYPDGSRPKLWLSITRARLIEHDDAPPPFASGPSRW